MANTASVWNPDNIRDVAETIGLNVLPPDVVEHLTRDVEFRIAQVLEEALKFMRHSKRTALHTQDVAQALRVLDVEPLFGYESVRPLRFGEASIGPGQPLYYVEDEEVDFERLINAPLPRVPRDMTFTAHWLAVEGVQPTIPQNPTPADTSRQQEQSGLSLLPKGPGGSNSVLAATAGADNLNVKPLVKHILSKELQLYFEHISIALLDETNAAHDNDSYRLAALNSLRTDPGLHQLVPYFVHFVAEKVTHNLKNAFILTQMLLLIAALTENAHLHLAPYISALVPPVLTCLVGKRLGPLSSQASAMTANGSAPTTGVSALPPHYALRQLAASVLQSLTRPAFVAAAPTLKPRLARTLLKHLLAPTAQPLGVYYGAVLGLTNIAGAEGIRTLLVPNLAAALEDVLKQAQAPPAANGRTDDADAGDKARARAREADEIVDAVLKALHTLASDAARAGGARGAGPDDMDLDGDGDLQARLADRLGSVLGGAVAKTGDGRLARAVLDA